MKLTEFSNKSFFYQLLRSLSPILSREAKLKIIKLPFLALVAAIFEIATIGLLVPFINVLINQAAFLENKYVMWSMIAFNIPVSSTRIIITSVFFFLILFSCIFRIFANRQLLLVNAVVGTELSNQCVKNILKQELNWKVNSDASNLIVSSTRKIDEMMELLLNPILVIITSSITLLIILAFLLVVSPMFVGTALTSVLIVYIALSYGTKKLLKGYSIVQASFSVKVMRTLRELMSGFQEIKLYNLETNYAVQHLNYDEKFRKAQAEIRFLSQSPKFILEMFILIVGSLIALYLYTIGALQEKAALLLMVALGLQKALPYAHLIYSSKTLIRGGKESVLDVLAVLNLSEISLNASQHTESNIDCFEKLQLERVFFTHERNERIFENFSFSFEKGDRVCVLGPSGSGKSSLLNLILGLVSPTSGEIKLNGLNLENDTRSKWHEMVAYVPQVPFLKETSVAENIAFGVERDKIDILVVEEVLAIVDLLDHIKSFPGGIWSTISEDGSKLSGGQRQRLCIARSLYKKSASILILDEPTSALNQDLGNMVLDKIIEATKFDLIVLVTHNELLEKKCNKTIRLTNKLPKSDKQ